MKNNNLIQNKKAFSLAEAMIMLVIISILMALIAPLIVKKASVDNQRFIFQGISPHSVTAMGSNQNLGVGINSPDAKLTVKSTKSNKPLIAKFESIFNVTDANNAANIIFQVKPKATDYVDNNGNPDGFQVYANGSTNAGCFPDYKNAKPIINDNNPNANDNNLHSSNKNIRCNRAYQPCYGFEPKENGYILSPRTLFLTEGNDWPMANTNYPNGVLIFHPATRPIFNKSCPNGNCPLNVITEQYRGTILAPVSKRTKVLMAKECAVPNGVNCSNGHNQDLVSENDPNIKMYFIPCKK